MKRSLHPLTMWIWALLLITAVVLTDRAWVALGAIGVATVLVKVRSDGSPWGRSYWIALRIGAVILVIRAVVGVLIGVPIPGTTLFTVPIIDLPSWMPGIRLGGAVTLERLSSSLHEGLIIATVIALFGAATSLTSPHKVLRTLPFFIYEIGITLVIATSLFPQLAQSARRIRLAQQLRGHEKVSWRGLALPLLEESLSRSLQLAASMDSRGFGVSRKRSRYRPEKWQISDSAVVALTLLVSSALVLA
ncbi:CbiQ ABC-type cobalt transport system, permease component CbiQ and related transporters [Candidatus Nanopelagicaceae bacterium]